MKPSRLSKEYMKTIRPALQKKGGYSSIMAVPRIERIVVNSGLGKFMKDKQALEDIERDIAMICGQRPVRTKARMSISSFGVREGGVVGMFVSLRGQRMYHFLDRMIRMALPRVRDFRGLSVKNFDGHGNYSFGVPDQEIFPEVAHEDIATIFGLQVTIITTANTDKEARQLLEMFRFPLTSEDVEMANEGLGASMESKEAKAAAAKERIQEQTEAAENA